MQLILGILAGTPWWVWCVLALLIWLGWLGLHTRQVHLVRLFLTPAFFITWGSLRLIHGGATTPSLLGEWVLGAIAGGALGYGVAPLGAMRVDRAAYRVTLPGHWLPLTRNVVIFGAKYAIGVMIAMHPAMRGDLSPWDFAISGASAGYFLGWLVRFARVYRHAPPPDGLDEVTA